MAHLARPSGNRRPAALGSSLIGRLAIGLVVLTIGACGQPTLTPTAVTPSLGPASGVPTAALALQRIGAMNVPRAVHSATRLADGRVLVAGGCTSAGCDTGSPAGATAELFDPASATFAPTGAMLQSRDDHAAVLLPDGRVLVAGGWTAGGVTASTELYDPAAGTFAAGPDMSSPRAGVTAVLLEDGRVLLAGGFTDNRPTVASADLFDPETNTMAAAAPMSAARGAYAATRLADGRVLIAGGLTNGAVVAAAELFDPSRDAFLPTGSMAIARYKADATLLPDGRAMILGGAADIEGGVLFASTEVYDPLSGSFAPGPDMRMPRYKLVGSVVTLADGRFVVAGGAATPEVYDPGTQQFTAVGGGLGSTRLFLTASAVSDAEVLLLGGYDESIQPTDAAWLIR